MDFRSNGFVSSNASAALSCYFSVMKPAVPIDVRVTDRVNITK
jgi:hypothetical protein